MWLPPVPPSPLSASVRPQGDSWPSLTARQPLKLAGTTRGGPSRVRSRGCTTTVSRCWSWRRRATPASRWRATFVWSGTPRPCCPRTPPPPTHWPCPTCPPPSWRPPPPWPPPPPAGSARPAWGRASQRSESSAGWGRKEGGGGEFLLKININNFTLIAIKSHNLFKINLVNKLHQTSW